MQRDCFNLLQKGQGGYRQVTLWSCTPALKPYTRNEHLQTGFWVKTCLLTSPDTCSNPELKKSIDQVKERYMFSAQAVDGCLLLCMFGLSHLSRSCMIGECCRTQGVADGLARASEVARDATAQLKQQTTQVTVQQM